VRCRSELAYEDTIRSFAGQESFHEAPATLRYIQVVTREDVPGALNARVTTVIENGELERAAGLPLCQERARIMICGNPEMVEDTRKLLLSRGFSLSRRGQPGHLALENLW